MISTDKFTAEITDNGANGCGIAKQDGVVCFVPFSIAGEKVLIHTKKFGKNFCECALDDVISPSEHRVEPKCKYFGKCGGCQLQHMDSPTQLTYKTKQIKTILQRALKKNTDVKLCQSQNCYHYRNKLNFAIFHNTLCFADTDGNFFPVQNCPLFVRDISDIIDVINDYLASTKNEFRAFHIRLLDGVYQFTFVSNSYEFPHSQQLISKFLQKNINFSLNLCKNTQKNSSNITEDVICLYGEANQVYDVLGIKSKVAPASFLQVNKDVQNKIYQDINTLIAPNANVINAYGGTGILAAMMAKKAQIVYSVELNRLASKNCRDMINKNNIKNIIAVCGDCQNEIPKILQKNKITHIVFDPPRNGINKNILELVTKLEIENIIYLSCNPSSLARDLETLSDKYEIILIQPYDMFPQTHHVETLVSLKFKA
ncbi:MAG: 23S rRNA (uracil(1939)-C(5))-methyltransferase RlmD [Christensenellales bacterium]